MSFMKEVKEYRESVFRLLIIIMIFVIICIITLGCGTGKMDQQEYFKKVEFCKKQNMDIKYITFWENIICDIKCVKKCKCEKMK